MFKHLSLIMLLTSGLDLLAQDDLVIPWVTNTVNFRGQIIINNLNPNEAEVFLVATRNNGEEDAAVRTIPAFGQLVESTASLFQALGEGPGYRVLITGDQPLRSAFVVSATGSASGNSPAQGDAILLENSGPVLLFNFLPITDQGASAPVVVNLGGAEAQVTFHAYQDGVRVASSDPVMLEAGVPFADVTANLFPSVSGDVYVVAESDQPLVGLAFTFNSSLEPSMANALVIDSVPDPSAE